MENLELSSIIFVLKCIAIVIEMYVHGIVDIDVKNSSTILYFLLKFA